MIEEKDDLVLAHSSSCCPSSSLFRSRVLDLSDGMDLTRVCKMFSCLADVKLTVLFVLPFLGSELVFHVRWKNRDMRKRKRGMEIDLRRTRSSSSSI